MMNPEREFEYNRNELIMGPDEYRREGARAERLRIAQMIQDMTKKPSAIVLKIVERLRNDDF